MPEQRTGTNTPPASPAWARHPPWSKEEKQLEFSTCLAGRAEMRKQESKEVTRAAVAAELCGTWPRQARAAPGLSPVLLALQGRGCPDSLVGFGWDITWSAVGAAWGECLPGPELEGAPASPSDGKRPGKGE